MTCACGSGLDNAACCGRFHSGAQHAATAEQLMRSRYCAYVHGDESYLISTWHPSTRPSRLDLSQPATPHWLELKIIRTEAGQQSDANGVVEFVARYKINGKAHRLHEVSQFVKELNQWFYVSGEMK